MNVVKTIQLTQHNDHHKKSLKRVVGTEMRARIEIIGEL